MNSNANSRRQAFADLVSIDAWHNETTDENPIVDLHVDLNFGQARVGGEKDSPATFVLKLKQAELVLVIGDFEPARVVRPSIERFDEQILEQVIRHSKTTNSRNGKIGAKASLSPLGILGDVKADASAEIAKLNIEERRSSYTAKNFKIDFHKNDDGKDRWVIRPNSNKKHLENNPWGAAELPIAKIKDTRTNKNDGMPPSIRLEIHCKREDLIIDQISFSNNGLRETIKRMRNKNKILAAESYIREKLAEGGLDTDGFDVEGEQELIGKYAKIRICSVSANIELE